MGRDRTKVRRNIPAWLTSLPGRAGRRRSRREESPSPSSPSREAGARRRSREGEARESPVNGDRYAVVAAIIEVVRRPWRRSSVRVEVGVQPRRSHLSTSTAPRSTPRWSESMCSAATTTRRRPRHAGRAVGRHAAEPANRRDKGARPDEDLDDRGARREPTVFLVNACHERAGRREHQIAEGVRRPSRQSHLIENRTHDGRTRGDLDVVCRPRTGSLAGILGRRRQRRQRPPDSERETRDDRRAARARPELYRITDSWRVTTVAESLSPSRTSSSPDERARTTRRHSSRSGPRARALLAALGTSCDTDSAASAYALDALAIELSIGTPSIGSATSRAAARCRARVTSSPNQTPLEAVSVVLDGVGLGRCEATTTATGTYECVLPMDLANRGRRADSGTGDHVPSRVRRSRPPS